MYAQLYHYEKYDIEKGLSQINVTSLYEDELGFLWIGTMGGGLSRFDGQNFLNYNEKDGIPGELVTSIAPSPTNTLLVGSTWGGIAEYNEGRFTPYHAAFSYSGTHDILSFKNTTWLASSLGLFWLKGRSMVRASEEEIQHNVINCLAHDEKYLYALSYNKIFVVEPVSKTLVKTIHFTLPTEANVLRIHQNKVYIGTKGSGIFYTGLNALTALENNSMLGLQPLQDNKNNKVNFIYIDNGNGIWTGLNDQKLYNVVDGRLIENKNFSFSNNANFNSMLIDRGGTIWLGTDALGLLKIINPVFINYSNDDFLNDPNLFSITTDKNKNLWVGSRSKGLLVYNEETGYRNELNQHNGFNNTVHTVVYKNNTIYCGTENGLYLINPDTYKQVGKTLLPDYSIKNIAVYDNGTIAAGTGGHGLILIDKDKTVTTFNEKNGFIHNYVHSLLLDKTGRLWVGTGNGMSYILNKKAHRVDNSQLCNSYVGCLSEDNFGNIWLSTDRCLMKYDGMKFEKYDRSNGLVSNTLYLVKCDKKNNVWVGSNAGLNRLVLGAYGKVEKTDHFSMEDGFIGNECNSRGVYETPGGDLYFCTIRGLIKYLGQEEYKTVCNHKVLVNGLSIFYSKPVFSEVDHGKLKHGTSIFDDPVFYHHQNHITLQYICTEKCKPNDVSFSFKLDNFDKKWSPPTKNTVATYSNLPPGKYTFRVKTLDKNMEATGITDTYTFTIRAAFWQKPWFYVSAAVFFFGLLAFLKFRTEQKEELQRVQLEKKVNQRTIELIRQKEERELLLKEIHHRVKNNLQIINSLINIQAGQIKDAQSLKVFEECKNRIKSMAIIHTKFYESKDFSKIDLANYVQDLVKDLIHTYNVNKNIELVCNINSIQLGIDTVIPIGLILNEIISNSLKYAFNNVEKGIIEISLKRNLDNGEFEMIVGDNGYGFNREKFNRNEQTSLGLELIKILSEQLSGTAMLIDRPGTWYCLIFTEIDKHRSPITT